MSSYKTPSEVELVAIYRLEFYKKQKNWKFCKDRCKKDASGPAQTPEACREPPKSANSTKSILNKTYNVNPDILPSDLNDAFLEPDPDKILPTTLPDATNTQTIKNTSKSISEPNVLDQKWPEPSQEYPESLNLWTESPKQWPESKKQWPESQQWQEPQQPWPNVAINWPDSRRVWSVPEQGWHNVGQKWGSDEACSPQATETLRAYEADTPWPEPCPQVADNAHGSPALPEAVLSEADAWLRAHCPELEDPRSLSSGSAASFMRGAAAAPHSTELDLDVSRSDSDTSASAVACLSPHQLASAVSRHAAALRTLLHEASARAATQHRPRSTLSIDYRTPTAFELSCEERPTRDIDLFQPLKHSFVAGSFKNQETSGRGRGRLHRERLIGIGMGRPYRL